MHELGLSLAISDYDHVRDLTTGAVRPAGISLTPIDLPVEEIFFRFTAFREWAVSEMSMAKYASLRAAGDNSLTAIPVFPSRVFRHSAFYVRRDGDIREPAQLRGRRIGVPEWAQTATVYARGILATEWGVPLSDIEWVQAGVNEPGRREQAPLQLPAGISLTVESQRSLAAMLRDGALDAIISAKPPDGFHPDTGPIVRLLPDPEPHEREWHARTGVFPIMHVVALRAEDYAANRWIAMELLKAFEEAKRRSLARLRELTASRIALPWGPARVAEAERTFGELWPYGIEPNRATLEAFLGWCLEQGVCARALAPEELFAAEVQHAFHV